MSPSCSRTPRVPRAGVDPITDERSALALLDAAADRLRHQTVLVVLDHHRCGIGIVVVADTFERDAVVEIAARVLVPAAHGGRVGAAVIASVRPGVDAVVDLADAERWLELDEIAIECGVELVEWFVLGTGVSRPRDLVGAPPRW